MAGASVALGCKPNQADIAHNLGPHFLRLLTTNRPLFCAIIAPGLESKRIESWVKAFGSFPQSRCLFGVSGKTVVRKNSHRTGTAPGRRFMSGTAECTEAGNSQELLGYFHAWSGIGSGRHGNDNGRTKIWLH